MRKRSYKYGILIILSAMVTVVGARELVFPYEAFGPQILAEKVIGKEWWQWESEGGDIRVKYPIKVVVYWNESIDKIRSRYPIDSKMKKDYRYLEYDAAMSYLQNAIGEMKDSNLSSKTLEKTRDTLIRARSYCPPVKNSDR